MPEGVSFWEFIRASELRFYQQRDLGLDLYSTGFPGVALFALAVASVLIFLLAIFHVIPVKRHVVALLLGIGIAAGSTGFLTSYWNATRFATLESSVVPAAGAAPANDAQLAAVLALPLVVGGLTLVADILGCVYMALFWSSSAISKRARKA